MSTVLLILIIVAIVACIVFFVGWILPQKKVNPEESGSYRHYLHSRNCPCFRPLKDTVVVDGHKYLKMHKAYFHAPNCN